MDLSAQKLAVAVTKIVHVQHAAAQKTLGPVIRQHLERHERETLLRRRLFGFQAGGPGQCECYSCRICGKFHISCQCQSWQKIVTLLMHRGQSYEIIVTFKVYIK